MLYQDNRQICHVDQDCFFIEVERKRDSRLKGKAVMVGGLSDRGVVASCSYETRKYGVHAGMPMRMARQLCPDAIVMRGDMEAYSQESNLITQVIASKAPIYEKASIDEHYLDVSGMDKFFGTWQWSNELRNLIIKETGLPISLGLSVNKTVSKIATGQAKPHNALQVRKEEVKPFLSPLSIRKIPGVGEKSYQLLRNMGVSTIEVLTMIPEEMMKKVLGESGVTIWQKANGIDHTPVIPYHEQKSISKERTFKADSTDIQEINNLLVALTEQACFELREQQKLTGCITVKIRYANFDTHTQQLSISYTASDHILINKAKELFKKLYDRRMLIRLIGVRFSNLVQGYQQIDMFDDTTEMVNLHQALDNIRKRYGIDAVKRAVGLDLFL